MSVLLLERRPPFLVMAHHRSGSNFLNDVLQSCAGIECLNEPLSMHTRFFRDHDLVPWDADDHDPALLHASLGGDETVREFLLELKAYLGQSRRGRVIGFKDTCLFGKLGWLKAFLPELRVIFLRRDPRAIVSSVLRSKLTTLWSYSELVSRAFMREFPAYRSGVPRTDAALRTTEVVAMSVALRYELARRCLHHFAHVSLELADISREPAQAVANLVAFLGAEASGDAEAFIRLRQAETRGGLFSSYRSLDDVENRWRHHLSEAQLALIDEVQSAVRSTTPLA
ncbi:sulfotransferase [Rhizobacter sp. SG703]|uniref:sulfotransferase n=1 Tax=Rhizobacter sp. SG703 TaxID=2587140 RepID=UPI001446EBE5|nr:sulfotransferase [Rhizobacter sp. SG703]NKI97584.1 hypothetical protein [Rhizobacter sp. SG703]